MIAQAALHNRGQFDADGIPGGPTVRLVYDDDLNITWLGDANFAQTSGYDADGQMTWQRAVDWADSLRVGGFTDWRLPTTTQPDPTCSFQNRGSFGLGCTGSEMGHLFYNELGGTASSSILGSGDHDLALFSNLQSNIYWSSTPFALDSARAWAFYFSAGNQDKLQFFAFFAWAVREGDVGSGLPGPPLVYAGPDQNIELPGLATLSLSELNSDARFSKKSLKD